VSFNRKIKIIRQRGFMSQEAFALELGVSYNIINRWKSSKCNQLYKVMKQIDENCKIHGFDFDFSNEMVVEQ
jgi:DNA-binding transcriptional regulator YiaG